MHACMHAHTHTLTLHYITSHHITSKYITFHYISLPEFHCLVLHYITYIYIHPCIHAYILILTYTYTYLFLDSYLYMNIYIALHIHRVRGSFQTSPFQGLLSSGPCWCGLFGDQCHVHRGRGPHVLEGGYFLRGMMRNILDIICCYKSTSNMNLLGP